MARALLVLTVVFLAGTISGMDILGSFGDVVSLIVLALAVSATSTLWAAGIAMRLRTMQAGPVMQMPVFILLFLAPVYVPLDLLTGWISTLAHLNPVTAIMEAARGFMAGRPDHAALAFACGAGLLATAFTYALRGLRRAELGD
jgi:ABC-2 type transport system permease protein